MISKELLKNKISKEFENSKIDRFIRAFIINYLYDKVKYLSKYIDEEPLLDIIDKNIYNLSVNLTKVANINNKTEIFVEYNIKSKTLSYCIVSNYKGIHEKEFVLTEFKAMMYREFEKIANLYIVNNQIYSNGFYLGNSEKIEEIVDIFADLEIVSYMNLNENYRIDLNNKYYILTKHQSNNSEVLGYAEIIKKLIGPVFYYYAINNPKLYSQKLIDRFNQKYGSLELLEKCLIEIKKEKDLNTKIQHHKQISKILYGYGQKANLKDIEIYLIKYKEE